MKKTITYCDCCGKPDAHTVSVFIDRRCDASGSSDNHYDSVDLCAGCMATQLTRLLDGTARDLGAAWIDFVKRKRQSPHPSSMS